MQRVVELFPRVYASTTCLSSLHIIDSPFGVFDPELRQHKFVEDRREENKKPVSTIGSVH